MNRRTHYWHENRLDWNRLDWNRLKVSYGMAPKD